MLSISNTTKAKLPRLAFSMLKKITDEILGSNYELSLAIVSAVHMKKLNSTHRGIEKTTDILSFPLSKTDGEMYICLSETKKESLKFDRTYENFLLFLFIHGCVHLKGFDHSSTMERIEAQFRKRFKI